MAGIYIHIPFCKQACHYCDFHFSTSLKHKDSMVNALKRELQLRKEELGQEPVATIYFGGGTPSVLSVTELDRLIETIYTHYPVVDAPEITLEANPDDLSEQKIQQLAKTHINRLSIGIQSFFDSDLRLMNRAHNAAEAETCVTMAQQYFENSSIDLIYGVPGTDTQRWLENIEKALAMQLRHISSYALTVEPNTALQKFIEKGVVANVDDELAQEQFYVLLDRLEAEGYVNYELSNFGKPGFFSKNNTAYWQGKRYLGIGPSAHSYDGTRRGWNVANNVNYLKAISAGQLPITHEKLTKRDRFNEYIMTGLRTIWGVSIEHLLHDFGIDFKNHLLERAERFVEERLLFWDGDTLLATKEGKFLADGIASDLFILK